MSCTNSSVLELERSEAENDRIEAQRPEPRRAESSGLADSIKSAAKNYEASKEDYTAKAEASNDYQTSTKAKSIAEKLGFMNFDDDEFDTPSYMRKDNNPNFRNNEANN